MASDLGRFNSGRSTLLMNRMLSPAEDAEPGLMAEGAILSRIVVRSHQGGEKIAIASTDPSAVEPALRSTYGDQLLMVQVPWTAADYEEAYRTLRDNAEEWGVITLGDQFGSALATHIVVALRKVTPEIAEWSAGLPRGLVDVRPWNRPAKEAEITADRDGVSDLEVGRFSVARSPQCFEGRFGTGITHDLMNPV